MEQILRKFLADIIRWALNPPDQPGLFKLKVRGETLTVSGQTYTLHDDGSVTISGEVKVMPKNITDITFPALAAGNPQKVNIRRFKIETTATPPEVVFPEQDFTVPSTDPTDIVVSDVLLTQGVEIKLTLVDIDPAGNLSVARELVTTPTDQTPPSQPGEFQMVVKGEVPDA